jgi:exodeoxyribonuclease VII large subunit
VFTPYQVNDMVDRALADNLQPLWIEGELADVSERGGHVYFSLMDPRASVRGVMFASDVRRVRHLFANGQSVRLKVIVGIYVPRGTFQIRAMVALPAGEGDRALEVLRLRQKLKAEGLFEQGRKRPLPRWPRCVGIITSRSGAAVHDIAEVARSRMPVRLILRHATVQGLDAPQSILEAFALLSRVPELEVIILARGGGGQEDLSAFDDEQVARAIAACRVPVVSGVGHEVDVTTADLVADVRAATPSHAAELTVPARSVFLRELDKERSRMERALVDRVTRLRHRLEKSRVSDPRHRIGKQQQRLEALRMRLERAMRKVLGQEGRALELLRTRLGRSEPRARLLRTEALLVEASGRVQRAMQRRLGAERLGLVELEERLRRAAIAAPEGKRALLGELAARLHALSPLGVLGRGYAIALHERTGRALLRATDAAPGDRLTLRLSEGTLHAEVVRGGDE